MKSHPVTIKMIGNSKFEVELLLMPNDTYTVKYHDRHLGGFDYIEYLPDFPTATVVFDAKVAAMGGH